MFVKSPSIPWEVGHCYVTGICSPASQHKYILINAYDLECELESVNRHVADALFYGCQLWNTANSESRFNIE